MWIATSPRKVSNNGSGENAQVIRQSQVHLLHIDSSGTVREEWTQNVSTNLLGPFMTQDMAIGFGTVGKPVFSHELLKFSWYFGGDCNHLFPKPAILEAVWFHTDYLPPTHIVSLSGRRSAWVISASRCRSQYFQRSPKQGHLPWLQAALVHVLGGWIE